ncbi:MAG: amidohydrolase family protein, partial [Lachnospiraceae bacterium]|nr:amidohydrolase family protein [Lachnospiraceae bacterium]
TYRGEEFFDSKRFVLIFEAVGELNVPITFHPNETVPAVTKSYYEGDSISPIASMLLSGFGIGWHYETGVAYLRLVASGLLDKCPDMRLIIGHWGEVIPYYFDRLEKVMDTPLKVCLDAFGADHIPEDREKIAHLNGEKLLGL